MSTFYKIDSSRVSHQEYWWWHQSPLVLISWLMKWTRTPNPCSSDDPTTDSTLPFVVESLPPEITTRFEPLTRELAALGFLDPVYHLIEDTGTRTTIYWATFRHESGQHFARIHNRVWQQAQKPNRALFPMFFTAFADGTFLVSSSGKPDLAAPATVQMNRRFGLAPAALWQSHQHMLAKVTERKLPVPVRTREDLVEQTERHHILVRDFHLARGVFRPRTTTEQAQADAFASSVAQAQASGLDNAEILAELEKLQENKPRWGATLPILVLSVILFVVLGAKWWNWQFTLWLIPILFLHEGGHWAAMRIFGYRNLRMFFIPLFGAAVTGRNWNVPGWKKALVSLAGPLPGIALGIFLGVAGWKWHLPWMVKAASLLVFINGFNLLPFLPLDGGRVLHTILFCRNRWLDVTFRVLAIGGLLLMGILGLSRVFIPLAFVMAISLPIAFKLARITDNLRKAPLPEPRPDEDRIPVETAQAIITEIKAAFPVKQSNKQIAQHTLNIYETLNARPPGTLGTLGLLAVHGGSIVLVLIFLLLFALNRFTSLRDFASLALRQPHHSYQCGSAQFWQGTDDAPDAAPRNLLVATFKKHTQAELEFHDLTPQLPANSRLLLFGDSLLLSLPADDDAARAKWFDQLQTATTNLFVTVSNQPVALELQCIAPTATVATNLAEDLEGYFNHWPGMHLVTPWSPEFKTPAFASAPAARKFWRELQTATTDTRTNAGYLNFNKQIQAARRRGANLEAARLLREEQEFGEQLEDQAHQRLRAATTDASLLQLIDLAEKYSKVAYTNRVARTAVLREIAAHLGEVKYHDNTPDHSADALGTTSGNASRRGLILHLSWVQLNDATRSLPALARWLCDQNCAGVKYDLDPGYGSDGDSFDPDED